MLNTVKNLSIAHRLADQRIDASFLSMTRWRTFFVILNTVKNLSIASSARRSADQYFVPQHDKGDLTLILATKYSLLLLLLLNHFHVALIAIF
jgi:hypothetical protein